MKYPRWDVNEQLLAGDLNALAQFTYQNHTDMLASFVESAIGDVSTGGKNVLLNGLKVSISGDDLEITPGMSLSYFGAYFDVSGAFGFQTSTVGQAFSAVLPESGTIAAFVTSDVVSGMESRGNVEIRPVVTLYDEQQRSFIDPNSAVVSNSAINVKGFFGAQLRIRYGTPVAANSVAPSEVNDWIKIGEIFVDNDGSTSVVDYADWTTGSNNFISLADELAQADIPYATRATPGLVEQATDNEFDNSDTTRYATSLQIQTALTAIDTALQSLITALQAQVDNLDLTGVDLSLIPSASETVRGFVERVTDTEFAADDDSRYATSLQINNAISAAVTTLQNTINGLSLGIQLADIPSASTAEAGLVERATDNEFDSATDSSRYISSLQAHRLVPPGTVSMYAGGSQPAGYLFCRGQAVNRTTYSRLFNAIGVEYGPGNGSTTFNVPDLQERFPMGKTDNSDNALGDTGGEDEVTLSTSQIPSHSHTAPSHRHTMPSHSHSIATHSHTMPSHSHSIPAHSHTVPDHSHTVPAHTHAYSRPGVPTLHAHGGVDQGTMETFSRTAVLARQDDETGSSGSGSTGSDGPGSTDDAAATMTGSTDPGDTNSGGPTTTGSTDPGDTNSGGSGSTSSQGGGQAHENRPPFVVLNFIIKT